MYDLGALNDEEEKIWKNCHRKKPKFGKDIFNIFIGPICRVV